MKLITAVVLAAGVASTAAAQSHPCPADTNIDGQLSGADFTAWISAFNANDTDLADQNGDGNVTATDFTAWINNYNNGCNFADNDGDRIPDIYENNTGLFYGNFATGTSPGTPDTDGDNILDGDEA